MEVKVYKRSSDHTAFTQMIAGRDHLVELDRRDYPREPIVRELDLESKIICGKESILSDMYKVAGIIEMELWLSNHLWDVIEPWDVVEFEGHQLIKTPEGYRPAKLN